jgi:hypothetical protein
MQKKQNIALEQKSPVKLPIIPSEGSAFRIVLSNEAGKNAAEPKEISAVPENEAVCIFHLSFIL